MLRCRLLWSGGVGHVGGSSPRYALMILVTAWMMIGLVFIFRRCVWKIVNSGPLTFLLCSYLQVNTCAKVSAAMLHRMHVLVGSCLRIHSSARVGRSL